MANNINPKLIGSLFLGLIIFLILITFTILFMNAKPIQHIPSYISTENNWPKKEVFLITVIDHGRDESPAGLAGILQDLNSFGLDVQIATIDQVIDYHKNGGSNCHTGYCLQGDNLLNVVSYNFNPNGCPIDYGSNQFGNRFICNVGKLGRGIYQPMNTSGLSCYICDHTDYDINGRINEGGSDNPLNKFNNKCTNVSWRNDISSGLFVYGVKPLLIPDNVPLFYDLSTKYKLSINPFYQGMPMNILKDLDQYVAPCQLLYKNKCGKLVRLIWSQYDMHNYTKIQKCK